MIVDLNDKAFEKAKDGDIFVIEEKNGKKYATPISKEELLLPLDKRLENAELKILNLTKRFDNLETSTNDKIMKIAKLVGGTNDEKKL